MSGRIFARYNWSLYGRSEGGQTLIKRSAQRKLTAALRKAGHGARGAVRSGAAGGPLILQLRNDNGRIVAEEL